MRDRGQLFKVIQGGLPDLNYMKNKLPGQFIKLKDRLDKVESVKIPPIDTVKEYVKEYENKYGEHLELIYCADNEEVKKIYQKMNNELIGYIHQAEEILQIKQQQNEKNDENII